MNKHDQSNYTKLVIASLSAMSGDLKTFGRSIPGSKELVERAKIWASTLERRGVPIELIEPTTRWFLDYATELPTPSEFADKALELKPEYFVQVWIDVLEGGEEKMACLEFPKSQWQKWGNSQRQMAIANHTQMRELVISKPKRAKALNPSERGKKLLAKLQDVPQKPEKQRAPKYDYQEPSEKEIQEAQEQRQIQIQALTMEGVM